MSCPFGRTYNEDHPVCKSCQGQLGPCKMKPKKRPKVDQIKTWHDGNQLITTKYLYSMNHWHGRPRHVYQRYKAEWREVLLGTWALWGKGKGKRRLRIKRIVTRKNQLIQDSLDNLNGSTKPIKDLLEENGVLINDNDQLLDAAINQELGREQLTIITVEDIQPGEEQRK